ncbi:MAG: MarC family NAAT transporter [Haliscomenobacter sp.]|nr:MarC family NAAT transporter [Haliscomenobacter sp.]MBK7475675.1 MarC family NAAT transporter [Haliscomenobacter sp.]MBK8880289.1 MarC family NAAT transporter [Haliscomenobacter sp.]
MFIDVFLTTLVALFSVVNPLGALPVYLAMTPEYTLMERLRTAKNTSIYFTLILLVFFFAGTLILEFFGIEISALRIAGGLVILNSGYTLLSGKFGESRVVSPEVEEEARQKQDISFSPMAMPLLSGPGSISLLIALFDKHAGWLERGWIALSILVMGLLVFLILRSARHLYRVMGETGLRSLSRIMGFIVMAIGVQYIIAGVVKLATSPGIITG